MKPSTYIPTDDEAESIERAGVAAALKELQHLDNDENASIGILVCLKAWKAATTEFNAAQADLLATKPGYNSVEYYFNATEIVCSAMAALLLNLDASEIPPISDAGQKISMLIKSAKALEAMCSLECALDDDNSVWGTEYAAETFDIAASIKKRNDVA